MPDYEYQIQTRMPNYKTMMYEPWSGDFWYPSEEKVLKMLKQQLRAHSHPDDRGRPSKAWFRLVKRPIVEPIPMEHTEFKFDDLGLIELNEPWLANRE